MSVVDGGGSGGGSGGQSGMVMVFAWTALFTGGESRVCSSSCEPAFGLPLAVPRLGAEVGRGEAPGPVVARIEQ